MTNTESLARMICEFYGEDPDGIFVQYTGEYYIDNEGFGIPEVISVSNWQYRADLAAYLIEKLSI